MSLVSYSKTVTLLSILDFLYILLCPGASEITFSIYGRSSDISRDRWRFWLYASFFNLIIFFKRVYDSSGLFHLLAKRTGKKTGFIVSGSLSEVLPDIWAVKCPCTYFSRFNTWHSQRSPAPKTHCCHLVPPCRRDSLSCCHPLEHKGWLGGAPGTGDTPLGVGPTELVMRSSLKVCLETPWKHEPRAKDRGGRSGSQVWASRHPEKNPGRIWHFL